MAGLCAALTLAGCATPRVPAPKAEVERISFRPQGPPFCGRCENTSFVVAADGELRMDVGHWAGSYRTWVRKRSVRRISPEQFADFKRRLEPYRPVHDVLRPDEACRSFISDADGLTVEWIHGDERRVRVFDFGCLDDRAMNDTLRRASAALGL
ncbi:hypothetical protein [Phenylobacterium sp.]|uniref:hypothetical protein n=1 Tax=Phenylobacterium sp. TaxID=1871053 RepID=UPI002722E4DD|nr:hypothetical protein [Phenylobacterium sp.]MDO8378284.1 hypothetical protein [Phenylobacterium sp.]